MRANAGPLCCLFLLFLPVAAVAQETPPAGESGHPSTPAERDPEWFEKLMARELEPLPAVDVASADGFFRATVPAKLLGEPQLVEGQHYFALDAGMGAEERLDCFVFHDDRDLSGSLIGLSENTFELVDQNLAKVEEKAIQRVHAGAIGPHAYMGVDWVFRMGTGEASKAGHVKHRIASTNGRAVYCRNMTVGFNETVQRVFESLVESIEYGEPLPDPHFVEIYNVTIQGVEVGVMHVSHRMDEEGDIKIVDNTAMLMPVDHQTLQGEDSITIEFSHPDGSLINELAVEAEADELRNNLSLDPRGDGGWIVSGTFQGKPLEAEIEPAVIRSDLGQRMDTQRFLRKAKKGDSITFSDWSDETDPTRLTDSVLTYLGRGKGGFKVTIESGGITFDAIADRAASMIEADIKVGAIELKIRRTYLRGSVTPPRKGRS